MTCNVRAQHRADTSDDLLFATISVVGIGCEGTVSVQVRSVDADGDDARAEAVTHHGIDQTVNVPGLGSTAATADDAVYFDNCQTDCAQMLQTKTK